MDGAGEGSAGGPGDAVREQAASPLDPSWELLDQNEHGCLVEGGEVGSGGDGRGERSLGDVTSQTRVSGADSEVEYEVGERVRHRKYGRGVVRWTGERDGAKIAGIELVSRRPHDIIPTPAWALSLCGTG